MTSSSSMQLPLVRVDQVGSLLRPEQLKQAFANHARGELTDEQLRQVQDDSIRAVIAKQEAHRLPVVTDGEFRRSNFMESFSAVAAFRSGRRASKPTTMC